MFDYRALYESQPSVSVDFLRVVQYQASSKTKRQVCLMVHMSAIVTVQSDQFCLGFFCAVSFHTQPTKPIDVPMEIIHLAETKEPKLTTSLFERNL